MVEIKIYHNNGSDLMPRINVALKDDKIVTIDEVERGLDCGCVCIHCHARLKARKGDEREHHFAHHDGQGTMACYENAFRVATREAFLKTGVIQLPIDRINEEHEVIHDVFSFQYNSVKIIDSVKKSGKGLEILVELMNEKGVLLDVLISTRDNSGEDIEKKSFRENISRIRINLTNFQALTFDEFRRFLANDTLSKEWIYNKKTDDKARKNISEENVEAVLNLNSVPKNKINKDKIINSNKTVEDFRRLGREIWEKNFKGKK